MSISFISIWLFSITDRSEQAQKERDAFAAQQVRSETGHGAAAASSH
jgi:cation/acetate symporter